MALQNKLFKIEELCRTCLYKEVEMVSVFEIGLGTITLDSIIASTTGIKIEHGDGLPSTICYLCKEKATNAYKFKARTHEANIQLRGLLKGENLEKTNYDNNLVKESETVKVKIEQFATDNHDDYMDMDLTLALSNVSETYNHVDTIKNEADDHCEDIFTAPSTENENLITDNKKNCFIDTLKYEADDLCEDIFTAPSTENKKNITDNKKKSFIAEGKEIDSTYCPVCGSSFHNAEDLTKHAWKQHADLMGPKKRGRPKKLLTSTILRKLSEHGYNLKLVPDQKHKCVFCKANFKTKDDWVLHLVQHKDVKVLSCLLCKKNYIKMKDFQRHNCMQSSNDLKDLKPAEPPDASEEERKLNLSSEMILQDLLITRGDSESGSIDLCEECGAVFISSVELGKHRDREHPELSSRCHLCDKVFATLKSAARHRAVCAQVERLFACASCGLRFAHEVSLNKHILRAHTGQSVSVRFMDRDRAPPQHRCDVCNRRFYRKDLLARHAKIHKSIEKCFECDICNKKFHRRDNLRSHMRVHDSRGAGVDGASSSANLCLYCGRSFSNSSNLIVHMRRHTGEKPYKCDFCGKGFPRSSDLQCHRRSHTGEKPCICIVCGKAFARSNKLSRHMRVHTGMKPYKCPHCEKAFSQSNDLKVHVRRHTGDKPYVCELCGDRFIQGTALHNHRRAHGHFPTATAPTLTPIIYSVQSIT